MEEVRGWSVGCAGVTAARYLLSAFCSSGGRGVEAGGFAGRSRKRRRRSRQVLMCGVGMGVGCGAVQCRLRKERR